MMEILNNVFEYASLVSLVLVMLKIVNETFLFYQQSHYHLISFKKIFKNFFKLKKNNYNYLLFLLIIVFFISNELLINISGVVISLIYLYLKREKRIVKLRVTRRIKRLFVCLLLVNSIFITLVLMFIPFKSVVVAISVLVVLENVLILISALIMMMVEYLIYLYYKKKCQKKLKEVGCKKIAITGSFGKTSTKALLYEILKEEYITFRTKKSYNTLNGICLSVNEEIDNNTEIAIFEFGASRKNDIKKLINLVKPDYGIITSIGPQHLESFKSMENIVNEKMKLAYNVSKVVLNIDDENIKKYKDEFDNKITVSIYDNADFSAQNIVYNREGLKFDVISRKRTYSITTKVLGRHNIYNILEAIALAEELNVKKEIIIKTLNSFSGEDNRLKLSEFDNEIVLNDSYNSNIIGFINALEVLSMFSEYKVLITPGVVEGGTEEKNINYSLGEKIMKNCDMVILIRNKASSYIKASLDDLGYSNVIEVDDFFEGFKIYKEVENKKILLIENDISDVYKI